MTAVPQIITNKTILTGISRSSALRAFSLFDPAGVPSKIGGAGNYSVVLKKNVASKGGDFGSFSIVGNSSSIGSASSSGLAKPFFVDFRRVR